MTVNTPTIHLCMIVFTANLLAITGDASFTWTSPVLPKLQSNDSDVNPLPAPITQQEEALIVSLIYLGFFGSIPLAYLSNKIGRKPVLLTISVFHIIAYVTLAFAKSVHLYFFARIIGGVATTSCYVILPMYIAEIAENSNRGTLMASYYIFSSFGSLLSYVLGSYLSIVWMNLILAGIGIAFFIMFGILGVESAHYYMMKNNKVVANKILKKLRGNDESKIKKEIQDISDEIYKIASESGSIFKTLKRRNVIKGMIIAILLMISQQLSGIAVFMAYTEQIFAEADITAVSASTLSIMVGATQLIAVGFFPILIHKFARKKIFLTSAAFAVFSEVFLGLYFYVKENTDFDYHTISWIPITTLVLFIASFMNGFGPIPIMLAAEMFPSDVKFICINFYAIFGCGSTFLVTFFYPMISESIGMAPTLWIFASSCIVTIVFINYYLPETKGKTLLEIQALLE